MSSILQYIIWFIVAIAVLVTVHEFGHYWVAKKLGVKVLRFSIGFGRPLFSWRRGADNTEYVIAALPLGGYVKMLDESEGEVDEHERHRAFNQQRLSTRFAVVSAGPIANFLFAILAYALIFVVGVPAMKPVIGEIVPDSLADKAGMVAGKTIASVAGVETKSWQQVNEALLDNLFGAANIELVLDDAGGSRSQHSIAIEGFAAEMQRGSLLGQIGIQPLRPQVPATIGSVVDSGAAAQAGLQEGDTIISANGEEIRHWGQLVDLIVVSAGQSIDIDVLRDGSQIGLVIVPNETQRGGQTVGFIGARVDVPEGFMNEYRIVIEHSLFDAIWQGIEKTWSISVLTVKFLFHMVIGQASIDNLSSPISIAQYAGDSADAGWLPFISFLAVVSISLGVLNLLPVPILDGGHLLFYIIEAVTGKPPSESFQAAGQQVGIVLIIMLMSVALYNDLAHIFG